MRSVPAGAIVEQGLAGALREAEHQLRVRFEHSPLATIESDTTFHVTAWNPAAERLFGYSSAEAIGQPISFLVAGATRARVETDWRERALKAPTESTQENLTKSGLSLLCRWHNTPLTAASGTPIGVTSTVFDSSERGSDGEAIVRSYRMEMLSNLADGIAHDFTNVFAVILSYANFIKDASPAGDSRRDDALELLVAAGEGAALTRRLLGISERVTAEKPIELNESLSQLRGLLRKALREYGEISLILAPGPLMVRIDPVQFDLIVLNLTLGVRDAMPNGDVQILLEGLSEGGTARGPAARMTIAAASARASAPPDTPAAFLAARAESDLVALGLPKCQRIVEAAGGTLDVQSGAGQGKAFVVELPLWFEAPAEGSTELELPTQGKRVLIAEAEPALRRAAARALDHAGYDVRVAVDYDEAVARLAELGPQLDVLVTDLALPGCAGYELVGRARLSAPHAAILVTAAFTSNDAAPAPEGIFALFKPVLPSELVLAVQQALSSQARSDPEKDAQGELVLVVEDDDAMRAALGRILEGAGYSARLSPTLADARHQLESGLEPALVLCDLSLPDGSSVELLRWILHSRPALRERVFILSGGAVDAADVAFTKSGAFPLLRKPIEPGPLLRLLSRARASSGE